MGFAARGRFQAWHSIAAITHLFPSTTSRSSTFVFLYPSTQHSINPVPPAEDLVFFQYCHIGLGPIEGIMTVRTRLGNGLRVLIDVGFVNLFIPDSSLQSSSSGYPAPSPPQASYFPLRHQ